MGHRTTILGLNAFHGDSSAALIVDGELVAAVEEERFRRTKHWAGFPTEAVRWCLEEGGIDAATEMAKGCPMVVNGSGSVEVAEVHEIEM